MPAKIRRMSFREKVPLREIARRTGLSRNTARTWLRQTETTEPKYPKRTSPGVVDDGADRVAWLKALPLAQTADDYGTLLPSRLAASAD